MRGLTGSVSHHGAAESVAEGDQQSHGRPLHDSAERLRRVQCGSEGLG